MKETLSKFTNAFGSITQIFAFVAMILATVGQCAPDLTNEFGATCGAAWLSPQWAVIMAGIFGAITFIQKVMRPGGILRSIFGSTAVVVPPTSSKSGPGTVSPSQVASFK